MTAMRIKSTGKKKTYNLEADLIERVRRLFNAKTDTDAIQAALRKAIEDHDIEQSLDPSAQGGSVPHHPPVRYVLDTNLCVEPVRVSRVIAGRLGAESPAFSPAACRSCRVAPV